MEEKIEALLTDLKSIQREVMHIKVVQEQLLKNQTDNHTEVFLNTTRSVELAKATGAVSALIAVWGWCLSVISNGEANIGVFFAFFLSGLSVFFFVVWADALKELLSQELYVKVLVSKIEPPSTSNNTTVKEPDSLNNDNDPKKSDAEVRIERVERRLKIFFGWTCIFVALTLIVAFITAFDMSKSKKSTGVLHLLNHFNTTIIQQDLDFCHPPKEEDDLNITMGDK